MCLLILSLITKYQVNMTSSDESNDESIKCLREAADNQFLNDKMFSSRHLQYKTENKVEAPRSLRYRDEENDQLQLTPEFKKFVAKHLSNTIEKELKEVKVKTRKDQKTADISEGVKLLSSSFSFLDGNEHSIPVRRRALLGTKRKTLTTNRSNSSSGDSYSDMEDFASAAVSPNWVISKKGINGWSTPTRGEVFSIKATNTKLSKKKKSWQISEKNNLNSINVSSEVNTCDNTPTSFVANNEAKKLKKSEKRRRQKLQKKLLKNNHLEKVESI